MGQANFNFIDDQVAHKNRYAFFYNHQQKFPYDVYLKGNINHVSDNQYTRDFDEDLPEGAKIDSRSRGQLRSNLLRREKLGSIQFFGGGHVLQGSDQRE